MISKKFIIDTINTEYSKWCKTHSKPPAIALTDIVIKKMRPFGKVDNRGVLYINSSYIGTDMYADVIDTIKHELAHLIVGRKTPIITKDMFSGFDTFFDIIEMGDALKVQLAKQFAQGYLTQYLSVNKTFHEMDNF